MAVATGIKRERVTLQQPTKVADAYGDAQNPTWADVATVWASVEPLRGAERAQVQQTIADVTHRVRIRYAPIWAAIDPTWRMTYKGRTLDVMAAINLMERNREFEIMAREVVSG